MKRIFLILCLILFNLNFLSAQNYIEGRVINKKGIPIPGAKVELGKGSKSIITNLDGTFRINSGDAKRVRISYSGMKSKTLRVHPDMNIKMKVSNDWNSKPVHYSWFLDPLMTFQKNNESYNNNNVDSEIYTYMGIMIGQVKSFGWYLKGVIESIWSIFYVKGNNSTRASETADAAGGTSYESVPKFFYSPTAGLVARLGSPFYLYLGGGFTNYKSTISNRNGLKSTNYTYYGAADGGLLFLFGPINLSAGVTVTFDKNYSIMSSVGFGICFW